MDDVIKKFNTFSVATFVRNLVLFLSVYIFTRLGLAYLIELKFASHTALVKIEFTIYMLMKIWFVQYITLGEYKGDGNI